MIVRASVNIAEKSCCAGGGHSVMEQVIRRCMYLAKSESPPQRLILVPDLLVNRFSCAAVGYSVPSGVFLARTRPLPGTFEPDQCNSSIDWNDVLASGSADCDAMQQEWCRRA